MIALRVNEQFILRLLDCPSDDELERKAALHQSVEVYSHNPQTGHDEVFEITNLHHEKDGWGVDHLVGNIIGEIQPRRGAAWQPTFVPVVFVNNELEADPLSLR